jgi:TonB family protein
MRKASLAQFLILFAATGLWSQQVPVPKTDPDELSPVVRDPHSNKADLAVPLCPVKFEDVPDVYRVGPSGDKSVTPPKVVYSVQAPFSDEARFQKGKDRIRYFENEISLIVDAKGRPQDLCVAKSAGYGLDAKAAEAIRKYEFDPAKKDGKPVAVRITVEVQFKLY